MKTIVTLTMNPALDKSSSVDRVVADRKLRCGPPSYEPGGGGINVSRAIKNLGGESLAIYPAGGRNGQTLQELLDSEGVKHRPVPIGGLTREDLTVTEESTGRQFRFVMPGPPLTDSEWRRCLDELLGVAPKPDYIVASGSLPPGVPKDFYAQLARSSKDLGARIIVDTSGEPLRLAVSEGVYLLKPNLRELKELTEDELTDESQMEALAMKLLESGQSEVVVISLGAAGALLLSKEGRERFRSPTVPIVSRVGAGDSMVAGIVLSLARGESVKEAVRFGVAAGAAAVMTPGSKLCRQEDAERLYRMMTEGAKP